MNWFDGRSPRPGCARLDILPELGWARGLKAAARRTRCAGHHRHRTRRADRLAGFGHGDDYVSQAFSPARLVAGQEPLFTPAASRTPRLSKTLAQPRPAKRESHTGKRARTPVRPRSSSTCCDVYREPRPGVQRDRLLSTRCRVVGYRRQPL